jgi:unsaturated rhamnogalacturonyl hydrolase
MARYPDTISYAEEPRRGRWTYEQGIMLEAIRRMGAVTGDQKYFAYVKRNIDQFVAGDGSIRTYEYETFNLDNIATGRQLLALYTETGELKYRYAADTARKQLRNQPRTREGGFWHKKIYPYQMWLDGLYMAEPFYARYALLFNEPDAFDDIVNQFTFIAKHTRDVKTGLFYHGWDESKQQRWANPETGCSPNFWGRAMGWYSMALVDVLDFIPGSHPRRGELVSILQGLSSSLLKFRDKKTALWYQVVDQGGREGNYLEASASCMFAYAYAKGANKGYLDKGFLKAAEETFRGVVDNLVTVDEDGSVDLHHTCQVSGLGGNPYRDGSYEYYIGEPQRTNDMKGYAPFLLAAIELETGSLENSNVNRK